MKAYPKLPKEKKEDNGGRMAHFFVAIAFNKGIVMCKQYHEKLTGERFAKFIKENFLKTFNRTLNPSGRLFLQDGDPRQVSRAAKNAMQEVGCQMFAIPARSPDLNPIENMFHLIRKKLHEDALVNEIKKETFEQFAQRVKMTIKEFSVEIIDKTIESMNKRIKKILTTRGERTKY